MINIIDEGDTRIVRKFSLRKLRFVYVKQYWGPAFFDGFMKTYDWIDCGEVSKLEKSLE
jgi:hypothetical protein